MFYSWFLGSTKKMIILCSCTAYPFKNDWNLLAITKSSALLAMDFESCLGVCQYLTNLCLAVHKRRSHSSDISVVSVYVPQLLDFHDSIYEELLYFSVDSLTTLSKHALSLCQDLDLNIIFILYLSFSILLLVVWTLKFNFLWIFKLYHDLQ